MHEIKYFREEVDRLFYLVKSYENQQQTSTSIDANIVAFIERSSKFSTRLF